MVSITNSGELSEVRLYKVEGYANILILIKESIPDSELLHARFIKGCIIKLNQERKRLLSLTKGRESLMNYWKDKPVSERQKDPVLDLYFSFDIDTEGDAIQEIERTFKRLGIPF